MTHLELTPRDWRSKTVVSVDEVGRILGISRSLAFKAVASGDIPSFRVGKRRLVSVATLRQMLGEDV